MAAPQQLVPRLVTALAAAQAGREIVVEVGESPNADEREDQRAAVLLLDAVCVAFD
jgi:hypothetical protein